MIRKCAWVFLLWPLFTSCEKSIQFTPNEQSPLLVVEATIENDRAPMVILSKTLNYFDKVNPQILAGSFVRNADVWVSNGTQTQRLKEYKIPDVNGYDVYYYSIDSSNLANAFVGKLGTSYQLKISAEGKSYTASTEILPLYKKIDSIWTEPAKIKTDSSLMRLMVRATDPPGYGNYIRYFTSVNNAAFLPGRNSVFDDQIIDGTTYSIQVEQGVNRNVVLDEASYNLFKKGDTITFKFCNITKSTFNFWRTMEYSYASIGNPFSTPTKVLGNIQGGALGYFGGYAVQYISCIAGK